MNDVAHERSLTVGRVSELSERLPRHLLRPPRRPLRRSWRVAPPPLARSVVRELATSWPECPTSRHALIRVATLLTARERTRVDAAGDGCLTTIHGRAIGAVHHALARGEADAALISAAVMRPDLVSTVADIVCSGIAALVTGLVTDSGGSTPIDGAFLLGKAGVPAIIDARSASGWRLLRCTYAAVPCADEFMHAAVATVIADIRAASPVTALASIAGREFDAPSPTAAMQRFLRAIFAPGVTTASALALGLDIAPATLVSRFFRAGLPSPKRYLAGARLVYLAHLAQSPGLSIASIAHRLDASSPQTLGRSVKQSLGITPGQLRRTCSGAEMLERFRSELIRPYAPILARFDPLGARPLQHRGSQRARRIELDRGAAPEDLR